MQPTATISAVERFEMLVQPHYEVLYRTAYRLTRSKHDAEDLAQALADASFPEDAPPLYGDGHAAERIAEALYTLPPT